MCVYMIIIFSIFFNISLTLG